MRVASQRIVAIGDIHGEDSALAALLGLLADKVDLSSSEVVFLGDYVDRGPQVSQAIDRLLRFQEDFPSAVFLRGNHEELMLEAREGFRPRVGPFGPELAEDDPARDWLSQGGYETLLSYGLDMESADDETYLHWADAIPPAHWKFIESTVAEHLEQGLHFVHAGLLPPRCGAWDYEGTGLDPRLWIREPFLSSDHDFDGRIVVFGHTLVDPPFISSTKIGIDTGATYGGPLTAVVLETGQESAVAGFFQSYRSIPSILGSRGNNLSGSTAGRHMALVVEDSPGARARIAVQLRGQASVVVKLSEVDSIQGDLMQGKEIDECVFERVVDMRLVARAYVDFNLPGRFQGDAIVAGLKSAGVPHVVGISSDARCNHRMLKAGADEAILKSDALRSVGLQSLPGP